MSHADRPRAVILDCEGPRLTEEEFRLFRDLNPYGFILFQRNCENPEQVKRLVGELRESVDRPDAPVLIDQEGGTIARLRAPFFSEYPGARVFRDMAQTEGIETAVRAAYENARNMARQLLDLGITVNCTPVLDIPSPDAHDFLAAHRVYGDDAHTVSALGAAVCEGHLACGVSPILKHIPGHGRSTVDSHLDLPEISASYAQLQAHDFIPFTDLSRKPWGQGVWAMTAHVLYKSIDPQRAGSLSPLIINDVIRSDIGFDGVLIADDVSMKALKGDMSDLACRTLAAGCDLTLICNQDFDARRAVLQAVPFLTDDSAQRLKRAEETRRAHTV